MGGRERKLELRSEQRKERRERKKERREKGTDDRIKRKEERKKKGKRETNNTEQCCHSWANSITGSTLSQGLQYTPSSDSIAPDIPSISEMKWKPSSLGLPLSLAFFLPPSPSLLLSHPDCRAVRGRRRSEKVSVISGIGMSEVVIELPGFLLPFCSKVVRYGMVWYGTVWYGAVCCGAVRYAVCENLPGGKCWLLSMLIIQTFMCLITHKDKRPSRPSGPSIRPQPPKGESVSVHTSFTSGIVWRQQVFFTARYDNGSFPLSIQMPYDTRIHSCSGSGAHAHVPTQLTKAPRLFCAVHINVCRCSLPQSLSFCGGFCLPTSVPGARARAVTRSRRPFFSQRRRLSLVAYKSAIDLACCWIVNADLSGGYQTDSLYVSIQKDIHQCQHVVFHLQQTSKWNKYMCHSQSRSDLVWGLLSGNNGVVFFQWGLFCC